MITQRHKERDWFLVKALNAQRCGNSTKAQEGLETL